MRKLREIVDGAGPARYPHLEAACLGVLGLGVWVARCVLVLMANVLAG